MSEKPILSVASPVTQSREAVVALLKTLNRAADPLPEVVDLGAVKLVLSNKKDVFYTTTARACSCPSSVYRPGKTCKHRRAYFPPQAAQAVEEPADIRPDMRGFRPFSLLPGEVA